MPKPTIEDLLKVVRDLRGCENAQVLQAEDGRLFLFVQGKLSRRTRADLREAWLQLAGNATKISEWKYSGAKP